MNDLNIFDTSTLSMDAEEFKGIMHKGLIKNVEFGNSANKYGWTFRKVPVTIVGKLSKKYVHYTLSIVDYFYDEFMTDTGYKHAAKVFGKHNGKKITPIEAKKNLLLDHVQIDKKCVIIGFNTTVYDDKFSGEYSYIVQFSKISTRGFSYSCMLSKWKK